MKDLEKEAQAQCFVDKFLTENPKAGIEEAVNMVLGFHNDQVEKMWHDVSEEPEPNKEIFIELVNDLTDEVVCVLGCFSDGQFLNEANYPIDNVLKYLYIKDLLPKE